MNKIDDNDDAVHAQKRQRCWAGEEMEMEHQREEFLRRLTQEQQQQHVGREQEKYYHAVNLEQFRNHQVGSGYQAIGVIRQRTAHDVNIDILDMSKKPEKLESRGNHKDDNDVDHDDDSTDVSSSRRKKKLKRHKTKRRRKEGKKEKQKSNHDTEEIEKYLKCKGIRDFRKELEKILSE
mmetsp:Transcript_15356/g.28923  ORF Transcript_15356/g.28923 Transcript_15356/m.28923 type:complete len:179 (+) Transcript_15356:585-1121(+)|eukprot:CAMPEP_0176488484 /NCGR_PEP_ID=MMETSP0200_2-20121128/6736_1 /TAXON_ID=947934 /ORGANISM="Chaetoceros sp., Strain GSL56" /LENGTH=178 /DNA_ID=CAMNT_0017885475 /DNA_START=580 /DNA_END=1116 /DNA_ORIENTATION=-